MATKNKTVSAKKAAPTKKIVNQKNKPVAKKVVAKAKPVVKKVVAKEKLVVKKVVAKAKPVAKKIVAKAKPVEKKVVAKVKPVEKKVVANAKPSTQKVVAKAKPVVALNKTKQTTNKSEPKDTRTIPTKPFVHKKPDNGIVLPKIKAKSAIPYNPNYATSILDAKENSYKNQARYSDADLRMFKQIIQQKLEASKAELSYLQNVLSKKDEQGGFHESENKNFSIEEGGIGLEKEQLTQMARRQIQFIDHLEKALIRIENKTYGICIVTGNLIDRDRLKAVPHAKLSLEAKMANNS